MKIPKMNLSGFLSLNSLMLQAWYLISISHTLPSSVLFHCSDYTAVDLPQPLFNKIIQQKEDNVIHTITSFSFYLGLFTDPSLFSFSSSSFSLLFLTVSTSFHLTLSIALILTSWAMFLFQLSTKFQRNFPALQYSLTSS